MQINPDMSEVVELKPGLYPVRVTASEVKKSQKSDNLYVQWTLTTFNTGNEQLNGRNLTLRTMISGAGAGFFKQFYKAATGSDQIPAGLDTNDLHGSELLAVVIEGKDQKGQPTDFPEVKRVTAYDPNANVGPAQQSA